MHKPKLYFTSVSHTLTSLQYSLSPDPATINIELNINKIGSYRILTCSEEELILEVKTSIQGEPESFFSLEAIYIQSNKIDTEKSEKFGSDEERLEYVNDNIEKIIEGGKGLEQITLLVGNITSTFGNIPLIIPPFFSIKRD